MFENSDEDSISFDQPDDAVARFAVEPRLQSSSVGQTNSKHRLREHLVDGSRQFLFVARSYLLLRLRTQRFDEALRHFFRAARSIDTAEQAPLLVVRQ